MSAKSRLCWNSRPSLAGHALSGENAFFLHAATSNLSPNPSAQYTDSNLRRGLFCGGNRNRLFQQNWSKAGIHESPKVSLSDDGLELLRLNSTETKAYRSLKFSSYHLCTRPFARHLQISAWLADDAAKSDCRVTAKSGRLRLRK